MAYTYTDGQGLAALDKTTPNGATETVSILDDAIRQIKAFMRDTTTGGLAGLFTRMTTAETNITTLTAANIPVGVMMDYGAGSAPTGWLVCDGSAVSRTTYATLFGIIGIVYGSGNGTTTFNVPDFRGRVSVMNDGGAGRAVGVAAGTFGGEQNHALSAAENGPHTHFIVSSTTVNSDAANSADPNNTSSISRSDTKTVDTAYILKTSNASVLTADVGLTSSSGSGTAHNNMQPFLGVASKIIKY